MASEGLADSSISLPSPGRAKAYNRAKLAAGIVSSIVSLVFLWMVAATGASRAWELFLHAFVPAPYGTLILFTLLLGILHGAVTLPLSFYSGFVLEHRYGLSNQSPGRWIREKAKGGAIGAAIGLPVLVFLLFCLDEYGSRWWIPMGVGVTILSVILARLAPVMIMPLFYTLSPLPEGSLRERIARLCLRAQVHFTGIFSFNLSKNTKKANAGFTGIGKGKRIILGDTLLQDFSEEEIESVFAHELGHYRHHHILVGMLAGTATTFLGLFIASILYDWSVALLGFPSRSDIAALPLLAVWLSLFSVVAGPFGNMLSRRQERQADRYAVRETGNVTAFASALRKLAATNLADPDPHPVIEFLFYSHPSIVRRLRTVASAGV